MLPIRKTIVSALIWVVCGVTLASFVVSFWAGMEFYPEGTSAFLVLLFSYLTFAAGYLFFILWSEGAKKEARRLAEGRKNPLLGARFWRWAVLLCFGALLALRFVPLVRETAAPALLWQGAAETLAVFFLFWALRVSSGRAAALVLLLAMTAAGPYVQETFAFSFAASLLFLAYSFAAVCLCFFLRALTQGETGRAGRIFWFVLAAASAGLCAALDAAGLASVILLLWPCLLLRRGGEQRQTAMPEGRIMHEDAGEAAGGRFAREDTAAPAGGRFVREGLAALAAGVGFWALFLSLLRQSLPWEAFALWGEQYVPAFQPSALLHRPVSAAGGVLAAAAALALYTGVKRRMDSSSQWMLPAAVFGFVFPLFGIGGTDRTLLLIGTLCALIGVGIQDMWYLGVCAVRQEQRQGEDCAAAQEQFSGQKSAYEQEPAAPMREPLVAQEWTSEQEPTAVQEWAAARKRASVQKLTAMQEPAAAQELTAPRRYGPAFHAQNAAAYRSGQAAYESPVPVYNEQTGHYELPQEPDADYYFRDERGFGTAAETPESVTQEKAPHDEKVPAADESDAAYAGGFAADESAAADARDFATDAKDIAWEENFAPQTAGHSETAADASTVAYAEAPRRAKEPAADESDAPPQPLRSPLPGPRRREHTPLDYDLPEDGGEEDFDEPDSGDDYDFVIDDGDDYDV